MERYFTRKVKPRETPKKAAAEPSPTLELSEPTSNPPPLPPEIFVAITRFLFRDASQTLLEFCLASRALYKLLVPTLVDGTTVDLLPIDSVLWTQQSRRHHEKMHRAYSSILFDSHKIGKPSFVRHLHILYRFPSHLWSWTAPLLLQRSDNLRSLVIEVSDPMFFSMLATAPFQCTLRSLKMIIGETKVFPKARFDVRLSSLAELEIIAAAPNVEIIVAAFDRGCSLFNLQILVLRNLPVPSAETNADLQLSPEMLTHGCKKLEHLTISGFFLHPSTIRSLAEGRFGHNIEILDLELRSSPSTSMPNKSPFLLHPLRTNLRFEFPHLRNLSLKGSFHSEILEGFSDLISCPSLSDIACGFSGADLGQISLDKYIFKDHFVAAISSWDLDARSIQTRAPWRHFFSLTRDSSFQPSCLRFSTVLKDIPERDQPNWSPSLPWASICSLDSLKTVEGVIVSTRDLLAYGLPRKATSIKLVLIMSGLTKDDVQEIGELLRKVESGSFTLRRLQGHQSSDSKLQVEWGAWVNVNLDSVLGDSLRFCS